MDKSQSSGRRCSTDQSECLRAVNDRRRDASEERLRIKSNRSNGSVDLLQDASGFFYIFISPGTSSLGDSLHKIPKRRNKRQRWDVTNEHMNERVFQRAEVLMRGESPDWFEGVWSSTGAVDVKDYGFCTVSEPGGRCSPGWGGLKPSRAPVDTHSLT